MKKITIIILALFCMCYLFSVSVFAIEKEESTFATDETMSDSESSSVELDFDREFKTTPDPVSDSVRLQRTLQKIFRFLIFIVAIAIVVLIVLNSTATKEGKATLKKIKQLNPSLLYKINTSTHDVCLVVSLWLFLFPALVIVALLFFNQDFLFFTIFSATYIFLGWAIELAGLILAFISLHHTKKWTGKITCAIGLHTICLVEYLIIITQFFH